MRQYLFDHCRIFNAGNHLHGATTVTAGFDVDAENTFQALCPVHDGMMFCRRLISGVIRALGFSALAPLRGRDLYPVFAVRRKHPVETCQVDAGSGYQRGQLCHEIQRLKKDVRGAITVRCLQFIPYLPGFGQ